MVSHRGGDACRVIARDTASGMALTLEIFHQQPWRGRVGGATSQIECNLGTTNECCCQLARGIIDL